MSRKDVLTRPRILLVVRAIVINSQKILLIQRSASDSHESLKWEIPGGKLDKGQDLSNAIERELMEEVGLNVRPIKQFVFFDTDIDGSTKYRGLPYIRMTGLYSSNTDKVRLSFEHRDYKWIEFEEALKADITEFTRKSLIAWKEEIKTIIN